MKKNEILIIGGTGFIGFHLAKKFCDKFNVTSISTKRPKNLRKLNKVKYIICDISNYKKLKKKIIKQYDYVINLGGEVNHYDKVKTYNSHYQGVKNLASVFKKNHPKLFLQIGSSMEYGNKVNSPHYENFKCFPQSVYGKAKYLSTKYLLKLYKEKKFPTTILRLYQVYGPMQDANRLISKVIIECKKDKAFPCSEGKQYRDFLHIEDLIEAIFKCFNNKSILGKVINIGSSKPLKVKSIIETINKKIKKGTPEYGVIKLRKEESYKIYPDISKARKLLRWRPKIGFKKGIKNTINSYK